MCPEDAQLVIREQLVRLEVCLDAIAAQMATKADIEALRAESASFGTSLRKWFIGMAVALASLAFAAGHFIR